MASLALGLASSVPGLTASQAPVPSAAERRFEVVSVKENTSGEATGYASIDLSPAASQPSVQVQGIVTLRNIALCNLIARAHEIGILQRFGLLNASAGDGMCMQGASGFTGVLARRFDIVARPPAGSTPGDVFAMLRTMLTERFKLRMRRELRPVPVYALMRVTEGRLGPKLTPSSLDCAEILRQDPALEPKHPDDGLPVCRRNRVGSRGTELRSAGSMTRLARGLQAAADRLVVDATGDSGLYAWNVEFSPATVQDPPFPTVFTAVREDLGLKLEPRTMPVEVFVIEHVEAPTPD